MRSRIDAPGWSANGTESDGERIIVLHRSCRRDTPSEIERMQSILVLFLTLSFSITLAAASLAATLTEGQLPPDDYKDRETQRLTALLNSGQEEVRLDAVIRLAALR